MYINSRQQTTGGFSLLEIMIAVGILGLVASIAIPSYIGQISKSRRTDAKVILAETAQRLERCFSQANTYQFANNDPAQSCPQSSDLVNASNFYTFSVDITNAGKDYTLTATAKGNQLQRDEKCKTLSLNHLNDKRSTNRSNAKSTTCW